MFFTDEPSSTNVYTKEEILHETTFEELKKKYSGQVLIWLFHDSFKKLFRMVLEYQDERYYLETDSILKAIRAIPKSSHIVLLTAELLPLFGLEDELTTVLRDRDCTLTEVSFRSGTVSIKKYVFAACPDAEALQEYERTWEEKHEYEKFLHECWLKDVRKVLREERVDEAVINRLEREVRYDKYI